jgi:hypothetical protein
MLQIASGNRPLPGVMFGLTHDADGTVIIREPRVLKIGIGLPKGRALSCYIHNDGKWYFRMGVKIDGRLQFTTNKAGLPNRAAAEQFYRDNYAKAEVCPYPRKIGFFTFTRPVIADEGEVFEPDFEAIEAHGPTPTEIDIVFLEDNPFSGAYQMWSASELKCKGDGINAMRVLSMAANDEERKLAEDAKKSGERYFPIIQGCWTNGCSYSKEFTDGRGRVQPSPCKPGGDLKFQLARNIRVGGTAYFHTSGYRSISHIFSSLERIKTLTGGRLAGIPLKMVLRPYRTKHNGQVATQYGVSLEFRAEDIESLRKNMMEQAWKFRTAIEPSRRLLEAPAAPVVEDDDEEPAISAQSMANEFYPEQGDDSNDEPPPPAEQRSTAATATDEKTANLAQKLNEKTSRRQKKEAAEADKVAAEEGIDPRLAGALGAALEATEASPAPTQEAAPQTKPMAPPREGDIF